MILLFIMLTKVKYQQFPRSQSKLFNLVALSIHSLQAVYDYINDASIELRTWDI